MALRRFPIWVAVLLWLLPWLLTIMLTAGVLATCAALLALATLGCLGHWLFGIIGAPDEGAAPRLLAAWPLGCCVAFGLLALLTRGGISILVAGWVVVALGLGALIAVRRHLVDDLRGVAGPILGPAILSAGICAIYFVPSALRDAVILPDGRWQWIYVDSQYWAAMTTAILHAAGRPYLPDLAAADLRYHFGPHAFSAALSALSGLEVTDCVARIGRPIGQIGFASAAAFAGFALGRQSARPGTAATLAVAAVFLYGSMFSLFAAPANSVSSVHTALLHTLPYIQVIGSGGAFEHLLIGGSMTGGGICLFTVIGLLVTQRAADQPVSARFLFVTSGVCAFGVCSSSVAGLAAAGIIAVTVARPQTLRIPRAAVALPLCLGAAVYVAMGLFHAPMSGGLSLISSRAFAEQALSLFVWSIAGLGVRHCALLWLRTRAEVTPAVVLTVAMVGFLGLGFLIDEPQWHNSRYGLLYLQVILSLFAATAIVDLWVARGERSWETLTVVCATVLKGWAATAAVALLAAAALFACGGHWPASGWFSMQRMVEAATATLLLCGAAVFILRRSTGRAARIIVGTTAAIVSMGACAWIEPFADLGLGRINPEVRLPAADYQALRRLRSQTSAAEILATNNHSLDTISSKRERNYSYGALTERRFVLQGWLSGGAQSIPGFATIRKSNDAIFDSTDVDEVIAALLALQVSAVVGRPGTDLAIAAQHPQWLHLQPGFAPLQVYRIDWGTLLAGAAIAGPRDQHPDAGRIQKPTTTARAGDALR